MILMTANVENMPTWVVPIVLVATGLYFLGKYEGWWRKKK